MSIAGFGHNFICSDRQEEGGQRVDLCIDQAEGEGEGERETRQPLKAGGASGSSGPRIFQVPPSLIRLNHLLKDVLEASWRGS